MRIVWGNLMGSMTVVMGTVVAHLPYAQFFHIISNPATIVALTKLQNYLFIVQYIYTPVVYLVFFPHFRDAYLRSLVGGRDWLLKRKGWRCGVAGRRSNAVADVRQPPNVAN